MTIEDELRLSYYKRIGVLNESHGVYLVQHTESKTVFVEKKLVIYNIDVYRQLAAHPIPGMPHIAELAEDDGVLTVIEEYISGTNLEYMMSENRLSRNEAAALVIQLCGIVSGLHSLEPPVIHRDIKPSNIIVLPDGTLRLIDLNAAKQQVSGTEKDTVLIGTQGYAAPEQYGFGASDTKTDIYAIGVLLSNLCYGDYSRSRACLDAIDDVIEKCTKIDPSMRYENVSEIEDALLDYRRGFSKPEDEEDVKPEEDPHRYSFAPPGFRSRKPVYMILSGIMYLTLAAICFQADFNGLTGLRLHINRIYFFLIFVVFILVVGNYRGILDKLRITKIENVVTRYLVAIIAALIVFVILGMLFVAVESSIVSEG